MIGLDTNTLLRLVIEDDADQAAQVRAAVHRAAASGLRCWVNRIALVEFVWVLESVFRKSRQDICGYLVRVLNNEALAVEDEDAARSALHAYEGGPIDFSDALIAVTNRTHGCSTTLTFDRKAARLADFQLLT
ncbi:MAG TPA: type II toxin-antitoxin system VapC family toxin [Azospirillum sp.]